jgi:hypothetical protein
MFSVGLLYSCRDFLKLNLETGMTPDGFKRYFQKFKYSTSENILGVSLKCGWVSITQEGTMKLTERGKHISFQEYKEALLFQIEDLILNFNPTWSAILQKGRTEARNFLPSDVRQCFSEAGLFEEINDELIHIWDRLALASRNYTQKRLTEIGRIGEKLSYDFELQRTGKKPIWQSIESNLSGFDLLSVQNAETNEKLQIEVKATTSTYEYAKLHLSRLEWETAVNSLNYIFHLWLLGTYNDLHSISVKKMEENIPLDCNDGQWESVKIPFKALI